METKLKRVSLFVLIFVLTFSFVGVISAKASTDYNPKLSIKKSNDTSVTLTVSSDQLKKKGVKIKIRVENKDTDNVSSTIFAKTLNNKGKVDIKISGLTSDVQYGFKALIKKSSDNDYSDYSNEVTINSAGIKDYNPKIRVSDTSDNDVTLKVSASDKLDKKKVNIKVRIENNDNDSVDTKVFTVTLNKSASTHIKVNGLNEDTEYNFKAMIKKTSDSSYSAYSDSVTQKTNN